MDIPWVSPQVVSHAEDAARRKMDRVRKLGEPRQVAHLATARATSFTHKQKRISDVPNSNKACRTVDDSPCATQVRQKRVEKAGAWREAEGGASDSGD